MHAEEHRGTRALTRAWIDRGTRRLRDEDREAALAAFARAYTEAADPEINLMPTLIEASSAYASLGEIMNTMAGVFGRHVEVPTI